VCAQCMLFSVYSVYIIQCYDDVTGHLLIMLRSLSVGLDQHSELSTNLICFDEDSDGKVRRRCR